MDTGETDAPYTEIKHDKQTWGQFHFHSIPFGQFYIKSFISISEFINSNSVFTDSFFTMSRFSDYLLQVSTRNVMEEIFLN